MRMNVLSSVARRIRTDLTLPPLVGDERLGVALSRYASRYNNTTIVLTEYFGLPKDAYVKVASSPVAFSTRWFMRASEEAARKNAGLFLVHLHEHRGRPWFSPIDMRTNRDIVRPLALIDQTVPTGALLFSLDNAAALIARGDGFFAVSTREVVG